MVNNCVEKIDKIIDKFLKEHNYNNMNNIEGIILYGSYVQGLFDEKSDIDIMIVFSNDTYINKKGYQKIDGIVIEFFEKSLQLLYDRANYDYINGEDTLNSIFSTGRILFDKNYKINELKRYILNKYIYGLPKLSKEDSCYLAVGLNKKIQKLKKLCKNNNPYYNIYYGEVLNKIMEYYVRKTGKSNIQLSKVYDIYKDDKKSNLQNKKLPDKKFRKIYIKCVESEALEDIIELYNYTIADLKINFENIIIDLKGRRH